jgi:hypothetical protein
MAAVPQSVPAVSDNRLAETHCLEKSELKIDRSQDSTSFSHQFMIELPASETIVVPPVLASGQFLN